MPIQNMPFDLTHGIEGVAQSPPRSNNLNVLPASTRVMPSAGLHTGLQDLGTDNLWLHASSQWDARMTQFLTPQGLSPDLLLPSILRARLANAREKAAQRLRTIRLAKATHQQESMTMQALVDVLDDDQLLRDMLENYRSALMKA